MSFSVNMSFGPMKGNFKAFPTMRSTALIFVIPITQIVVRSLKPLRIIWENILGVGYMPVDNSHLGS